MGEKKRRTRAHARLFTGQGCLYCGGSDPATTVEHMPPKGMFAVTRPNGLVFPACQPCNNGSSSIDRVAALLARVTGPGGDELPRLIRNVRRWVPGVVEEMRIGRGGQKLHKRLRPDFDGGVVRVGPLVNDYMTAFAYKLGMALHCEAAGSRLEHPGAIFATWYSNACAIEGRFPGHLLACFPDFRTLVQGRINVSDEFEFASRKLEKVSIWCHFAAFRESFSVLAWTALDRESLGLTDANDAMYPAQVGEMLRGLKL